MPGTPLLDRSGQATLSSLTSASTTDDVVASWLVTGVVAHVALAVIALVFIAALALTRRIRIVPTGVAALLLTWVPFVGPVCAVVLAVVAARDARSAAP